MSTMSLRVMNGVNITQALSKMKDSLVLLFKRPHVMGPLGKLFDLLIAIIELIRPGRKYPRLQPV